MTSIGVLLTGGTGFLGRHLLSHLAMPSTHVTILTRRSMLSEKAGVTYLCGDLTEKRMGLSHSVYSQLCNSISLVWHCAANTAFDDPYESLWIDNVQGSHNVAQFAHDARANKLIYVSTAFVAGHSPSSVPEEFLVPAPRAFRNNYERTKWEAELQIRNFCTEQSLPFLIFRPTILVGDTAGVDKGPVTGFNAFVRFFTIVKRRLLRDNEITIGDDNVEAPKVAVPITIPCDVSSAANLVCVDCAARWMTILAPRTVNDVLHIANDDSLPTRRVFALGLQELGITGVQYGEGSEIQVHGEARVLADLVKRLGTKLRPYWKYLTSDQRFETGKGRQLLGQAFVHPSFDRSLIKALTGASHQESHADDVRPHGDRQPDKA